MLYLPTNRMLYYCVLINLLMGVGFVIPRLLMSYRFDGALEAITFSTIVQFFLLLLFSKVIQRFPGQGLPEILHQLAPRWIKNPLLLVVCIIWYTTGIIMIIFIVKIIMRFITTNISEMIIMLLFIIPVGFVCHMKTKSIIHALDLLMLINFPIFLLLTCKAFIDTGVNWISIVEVLSHSPNIPTLETVSSATFSASGFVNMLIFNRVTEKRQRMNGLFLCLLFVFVLFTQISYFLLTIGFLGTVGVEYYLYPTFSMFDSLDLEYFFIERVLFIAYLLFSTFCFISTVIYWHVSLEFLKGILPSKWAPPQNRKVKIGLHILVLVVSVLLTRYFVSEEKFFPLVTWWNHTRSIAEIAVIVLLLILSMGSRKA